MKICSTSPMIREIQIETMVRCHLSPVRITVLKKTRDKCWQGCVVCFSLQICWYLLNKVLWCWVRIYLQLLIPLDELTLLLLYNDSCLLLQFLTQSLFYLVLLLFVSTFMEFIFLFLHCEPTCALKAEMSLLQAASSPFSHPMPFDCRIQSTYI